MLEISPEEVQRLLPNAPPGFTLIDIRETDELDRGTLPGAIHIAMATITRQIHRFQPGHRYIIYCEHGIRSLHVASWLLRQQIDAVSMSGGFSVWNGPTQNAPAESAQ